jgi:protein TonB
MLINSVDPEFTDDARKAGKKNKQLFPMRATLDFVVDEQGYPQDVCMAKGIGYGLDQKAADAVWQYRFDPALKDGVPIAVKIRIYVNFKIFY